jgi:hypothetical protein
MTLTPGPDLGNLANMNCPVCRSPHIRQSFVYATAVHRCL